METDPVIAVRDIIRYDFINENLMRQAFTPRAFSQEYGLSGCSEELEFYGDQVLGMVITREMARRFSDTNIIDTGAPFRSHLNEGELSRIRAKFVSKEHLSRRAEELGLDRFILYGTGEEPGDSAREDMMEALIGAVAVDSGWDTAVLEEVVDRLISLQLDRPDELLRESYYEQLNTWHQKHFGCLPEYELTRHMLQGGGQAFYCTLKYLVPENDKGIRTSQRIDIEDETRSSSREYAARRAVSFIRENGLWMNLSDSGCEPDPEKSINQLQELFQKKYVKEPVYTFKQMGPKEWYCTCVCNGFDGWGRAVGKTRAKKDAAFMVLKELMKAGGRNDQV